MHDLIAALEHASRRVAETELRDAPAHVVELRRALHAPVGDVWDACTNPERIPRWFLPVSGELKEGGQYQLKGNAGGTVTRRTASTRPGSAGQYLGKRYLRLPIVNRLSAALRVADDCGHGHDPTSRHVHRGRQAV